MKNKELFEMDQWKRQSGITEIAISKLTLKIIQRQLSGFKDKINVIARPYEIDYILESVIQKLKLTGHENLVDIITKSKQNIYNKELDEVLNYVPFNPDVKLKYYIDEGNSVVCLNTDYYFPDLTTKAMRVESLGIIQDLNVVQKTKSLYFRINPIFKSVIESYAKSIDLNIENKIDPIYFPYDISYEQLDNLLNFILRPYEKFTNIDVKKDPHPFWKDNTHKHIDIIRIVENNTIHEPFGGELTVLSDKCNITFDNNNYGESVVELLVSRNNKAEFVKLNLNRPFIVLRKHFTCL